MKVSSQAGSLDAQLPPELESVAAARHLLEDAAASWGVPSEVVRDAALAVSELVTNAVLHAGTTVDMRVRRLGAGLRIEVCDGSTRIPVVGVERADELLATRSMTGRGLAVVAATADRWGADALPPAGAVQPGRPAKVVWAEVGTGRRRPPPVTRAAPEPARAEKGAAAVPPASFAVSPAIAMSATASIGTAPTVTPLAAAAGVTLVSAVAAQGRRVHLVGVPVRLLVESNRHFADLQREMQVIGLDAASNVPALASLASSGRSVAAEIRPWTDLDDELVEAALTSGRPLIDYDVVAPLDAADRFERLGALLARIGGPLIRGYLLTLPPSREVIAYRRWYRDEILAQLGGRAARPCPLSA
ncbi:MAG: ATP-binding protein [Acidimicrobiales bacterium]